MDGAKSSRLFTGGCTPGVAIKLLRKTLDQDFFPGEERATKNPKVFSFDSHSTSNCHKLVFQGFACLNNTAFSTEKELASLC